MFRATTTCTFLISEPLKVERTCGGGAFWIFLFGNVFGPITTCNFSCSIWPAGSAPAALASLFFDPGDSGALNYWKNIIFRFFSYLFTYFYVFSSYFFFFILLSSNFFLLATFSLLCFLFIYIIGNLISKFPSIIRYTR